MVDSNYNGFSGGSYYWNGNKVTKARFDYELTRQQERILAEVNKLATNQATNAVSIGAGFGQQEFGGLLRQIMPNLLDEFGQINSTAALDFYQQQANAYWEANKANTGGLSRDARRSRETNFARARTRSAIGLNTNQDKYVALLADNYDTAAKSERVIGWTMKVRAKDGHQAAVGAMNNAITREVASYHRDTVLFNAALDPYVSRVQRVAQATACEFCRLMALGSTNGRVRVSSYAVKFHDHCHCTIQPLFDGEDPIRPDYYDEFESEYTQAKSEWNGSNAGTKQTLANWREIQKTKANGTYVEESQARWQKIEDGLKQSKFYKPVTPEFLKKANTTITTVTNAAVQPTYTGPFDATQVEGRAINPKSPENKGQWWWTKEYKKFYEKRDLIRQNNTEILALRAGEEGDLTSNRWFARNTPLRNVRETLPVLNKPELRLDSIEKANPKYDVTKTAYSSNCARVVQVYELRRRGFDVTASKTVMNNSSQSGLMYGRYWKNQDTGRTVADELEDRGTKINGEWSKRSYVGKTTYDDYLKRLAEDYEPGTRGIVQVQWSNSKVGHVFNFEISPNGKPLMFDAQTGKADVAKYFDRGVLWKTARLDDKEPMAGVLQYVEGYE